MANIAKSGTPSLATTNPPSNCFPYTGALAGEDIAAGDAIYLKTSDGRWYRCSGAADNAAGKYRGVAQAAASAGEPVTPGHSIVMHYGSGLTPGASVFLSTDTAGAIADANATVNRSIGFAVDATRVYFGPPQL